MNINSGDTAWLLISTALVLLMTPALAYFYGGLVRKKNVVNTLLCVFILLGIVTIEWIIFGYTMVFGKDIGGIIGGLDFFGLKNVGVTPNGDYSTTIPHILFMAFQLMFAIITPGLIVGSIVERMKFSSFIIFITIWSIIVYNPIAHWVWGVGGWIRELGAIDFAGGNVVHISSGVAGLVACIILGKRKGHGSSSMLPHNIPYIMIGSGLLWFGWLGFNGGSSLGANGIGAIALVNTVISPAAAMLSWSIIEYKLRKKVTLVGAATGALAGLVAITPGAGFVPPLSALVIGILVSPVCYFAIAIIKEKLGYDDALDAFGCHGVGGIFGGLVTGLFASKSINEAGENGLFYGNPELLLNQFISIVITIIFSAVVTAIILLVIKKVNGLRVDEETELTGLDIEIHGEDGFGNMQ